MLPLILFLNSPKKSHILILLHHKRPQSIFRFLHLSRPLHKSSTIYKTHNNAPFHSKNLSNSKLFSSFLL
ncbi:MAG: hypothetical protein DRQ51_05500 [Gammaproteobacteria bacterium]|nr:MAG: hypothetical protein DRQ51_05500 [Gammaproteobacteria bacterium]